MDDLMKSAVTEVMQVMLNFNIQQDPPNTPLLNGEPHVASSVGFIGRLTGVVYLCSTIRFAKQMTAALLGLEQPGEADDEMVGSDIVVQACKNFEESKDWRFSISFKEVVERLQNKEMANA